MSHNFVRPADRGAVFFVEKALIKEIVIAMKFISKVLFAALLPLLAACSVTQEVKDDVSFEGLTRIYVEDISNVTQLSSYYMNGEEINAFVKADIASFLKERGYEPVADKASAQIIFVPIWNFSMKNPLTDNPFYGGDINSTASYGDYYLLNPQYYATLEVQAYLPGREDWVWRGFSPLNMDRQNATTNMIGEQVRWCLQYFPPEKYPSRLQIYKAERAKRLKEEENPFSHIKPEGEAAERANAASAGGASAASPKADKPKK